MQEIEQFIELLMEQKGTTGMTQEEKNNLKAELIQMLIDQIEKAAIYSLSEEKADELSNKMDDPNFTPDQMTQFMQEAGVDFQQISLHTMMQFRMFYLGGAPKNERASTQ